MNNLPDFLLIPSVLIQDKNLRPTDLLVYGAIYWYTRLKMERCIASNKTLAVVANCSESAVVYALTRLKRAGYVDVRMVEHSREEIIPLVAFLQEDRTNVLPPRTNVLPPIGQMSYPPMTNVLHNKNIKEEELKNTLAPSGPVASNLFDSLDEAMRGRSPEKLPAKNKRLFDAVGDKYLLDIPEADMAEFLSIFTSLTPEIIKAEAQRAYEWHQQYKKGGVSKKDFKSFIKKWIAKTNASRSVQKPRFGGIAKMED